MYYNPYDKFAVDYRIKEIEDKAEKDYIWQKQQDELKQKQFQKSIQLQQVYKKRENINEYLRNSIPKGFDNIYKPEKNINIYPENPSDIHERHTLCLNSPQIQETEQNLTQQNLTQLQHFKSINNSIIDNKSISKSLNYTKNQQQNVTKFPNQLQQNHDFNIINKLKYDKQQQIQRQFIQNEDVKTSNFINSKKCKAWETKVAFYQQKQQDRGVNVNNSLLECKMLLNVNQYQQAEKILENICNQNITHADVFYLLGETKRLLEKYKEAEYYLIQSMQFQTHSPFVFNSLALVYMATDCAPRAILLFLKYLELNVDNKTYFNLGRCYSGQKQYLEAAIQFTKAIELKNDEAYFYLHRGECYEALGFAELSITDYNQFKMLNPDYINNLNQQFLEAQNNGDSQSAFNIQKYIKKLQSI